jgi:hypothetical protein
MKVYITKYSLTQGIEEIEATECGERYPGMIETRENGYTAYYHGEGRQWHRSKEAAVEKAEKMRLAKIASLKKQIAKLEKLTFN